MTPQKQLKRARRRIRRISEEECNLYQVALTPRLIDAYVRAAGASKRGHQSGAFTTPKRLYWKIVRGIEEMMVLGNQIE